MPTIATVHTAVEDDGVTIGTAVGMSFIDADTQAVVYPYTKIDRAALSLAVGTFTTARAHCNPHYPLLLLEHTGLASNTGRRCLINPLTGVAVAVNLTSFSPGATAIQINMADFSKDGEYLYGRATVFGTFPAGWPNGTGLFRAKVAVDGTLTDVRFAHIGSSPYLANVQVTLSPNNRYTALSSGNNTGQYQAVIDWDTSAIVWSDSYARSVVYTPGVPDFSDDSSVVFFTRRDTSANEGMFLTVGSWAQTHMNTGFFPFAGERRDAFFAPGSNTLVATRDYNLGEGYVRLWNRNTPNTQTPIVAAWDGGAGVDFGDDLDTRRIDMRWIDGSNMIVLRWHTTWIYMVSTFTTGGSRTSHWPIPTNYTTFNLNPEVSVSGAFFTAREFEAASRTQVYAGNHTTQVYDTLTAPVGAYGTLDLINWEFGPPPEPQFWTRITGARA
jgi:hypothetical protein